MHGPRYGKPFQFLNFMVDIPGFLDVVAIAWALPCKGSPTAQFCAKNKQTKQALRDFNKLNGNTNSNIQLARANLDEIQSLLSTGASPQLLARERDCVNKLNSALAHEESLLF